MEENSSFLVEFKKSPFFYTSIFLCLVGMTAVAIAIFVTLYL